MKSILLAFSMFSRIPVRAEWSEASRRYLYAAFPLVGAALGGVLWLWQALADALAVNGLIRAAGMIAAALMFTGGIHLDGFADVTDALASHADAEKKRAILKDPHTGAFAVMGVCVCLMTSFALLTGVGSLSAGTLTAACALSRTGSALCSLCFPAHEGPGLLSGFRVAADRKRTLWLLGLWAAASAGALILLAGLAGLLLTAAAAACCLYTGRMARREFGGMSGDLSGWCVVATEWAMLLILAL